MKRIIFTYAMAAFCAATILACFVPSKAFAATRTLQAIKTVTLADGGTEVDLQLSSTAPQPVSFSVNKPAMIVLDLDSTASLLDKASRTVNVGDITRINTASTANKTRVVVHLGEATNYKTRVKGNHVYLILGGQAGKVASSSPAAQNTFGPVSGKSSGKTQSTAGMRSLSDVSFHRTADGAGRIEIDLSGAAVAGNVKREGNKVIVTFPDASVPQRLLEKLNVTDFATPVTTVTTQRRRSGARVTIQASGPFEQLAYQANNTFAVVVKPHHEKKTAKLSKKQYSGKKLTLNFQSIPVRRVLQILAQFTGKNIVVSGSVNGNITLRLHDVPWDEALALILKTQGLAMRKVGDIIMIAPAVELAQQEQQQLKAQSQVKRLAPLQTSYIQVNYAKASQLAALVQSQKNSLLSKRGVVSTDQRTNTLIVRDTPGHISQVRKLVHVLDIPVRQVLIESRIVIAQNTYERDLGTRFGVTGGTTGDNSTIATSGNLDGTNTQLSGQTPGSIGPPNGVSLDDRLNVNVPVSNPAGQFAISILNSAFQIDLELSAMQAEGKGKVVSSPRVITADQQTAKIEQGVEIPYQNASSSGATAVQFKKATLSLEVTPQITPDKRILMDIEVHKDSIGQYISTANGGQVPSIDTRVVKTNVLVDNGDTVVLGGIYEVNKTHSTTKVPLLGDIPILGYLFRSTKKVNNKKELLIFVTPKLLASSLSEY